MKAKFLKTAFTIVIVMLSVIIIKSCTKAPGKCTSCEVKPVDAKVSAKFEPALGGVNLDTKIWFGQQAKKNYELSISAVSDKNKFALVSDGMESVLKTTKMPGETTVGYVFYKKVELHKDSVVLLKDVVAVGRYSVNNHKIYHQFFVRNDGENKFIKLIELCGEVDGFVTNHIRTIAVQVLNIDGPSTAMLILNSGASDVIQNLHKPHDELEWKLKIYLQKQKLQKSSSTLSINSNLVSSRQAVQLAMQPTTNDFCADPCTSPGQGKCSPSIFGIPVCGGSVGICGSSSAYNLLVNNSVTTIQINSSYSAPLDNCLTSSLLYSFRDNVLYNTEFGQKYINYYYLLSAAVEESLDLETALKVARAGYDVNGMINLLMNANSNPNAIVLTNSISLEITKVLAPMRIHAYLANDQNTMDEIDDISNDLESFQNQTVAQVRQALNINIIGYTP